MLVTKPLKITDYIDVESRELLEMHANEIKYLVIKNYEPKNLTNTEWQIICSWFK